VRLHAKGEPLFLSDAMPKDIAAHVAALEAAGDARVCELGARLSEHLAAGTLQIDSHQFWTVTLSPTKP